jgi:carbamoyltransferase
MNCSANGRLLASGIAERMWLFPASGDAGLSVGAALLASRDMGASTNARIDSPYWGPAFTDDECEEALNAAPGLSFTRANDLSTEVATALARGDVIGWFQGRMELGPRALGNRSILADPRSVAMRDKANRVKRREQWRPLAPSILAERTEEWFEMVPPNSFMLFAVQALNSPYYDLISAFERITGVPILLNTSFNDAGEPIVCTPEDALRTFLATDLDALVLGPFIARKYP